MEKFRPLAMINCSFKIFSKCTTSSFDAISNDLIAPNQTAFIKARFIVESMVAAHGIIHFVATKNLSGFMFKLDYDSMRNLMI